jgi:hypothetical protein
MKCLAGLLGILFGLTCSAATISNGPIARVFIGGNVYSNVVVETVSAKSVTFFHSRGMATVNPQKLSHVERQALGLEAPPPPAPSVSATGNNSTTNRSAANSIPLWDTVQRAMTATNGPAALLRRSHVSLPVAAASAIAVYLFICFCLMNICAKAGPPAPLLAWIPLLQVFAIYRAAKMAPFWFALLMCDVILRLSIVWLAVQGVFKNAPQLMVTIAFVIVGVMSLIHAVGWIIWCFRICTARDKNPALGILVLIPCTQVPALAYLAFSK